MVEAIAWADFEAAVKICQQENNENPLFEPIKINRKRANDRVLCERKIHEWKRRNFISSVDDKHVCSTTCINNQLIQSINRELRIFGCSLSGKTHVCDNLDCKKLYRNGNGELVCLYSGNVINPVVSKLLYAKEETSKEELNDDNAESDDELYDNFNCDAVLFEFKNDSTDKRKESKLKRMKYDEDDIQINKLKDTCRSIITDLLFNKKNRNTIESINQKDIDKKIEQKLKAYYKECMQKGVLPVSWNVDSIIQEGLNIKHRLLLDLPKQDNIIYYYMEIIIEIWQLIANDKPNENNGIQSNWFKQFVIGVLYMLQQGMFILINKDGPSFPTLKEQYVDSDLEMSSCASLDCELNLKEESVDIDLTSDEIYSIIDGENIKMTTVQSNGNMIDLISVEEEFDTDENFEDCDKIKLVPKHDYLVFNLPDESDLSLISSSINSKNYAKNDFTVGIKLVKSCLLNIRNKDNIDATREKISKLSIKYNTQSHFR